MADVGERAQVLLMAALGMAILFVALALILNTAIYTENLATRGSEVAGGGDAVRFLDTTRVGVGGTIAYVNRHNHTSNVTLQQNLSKAVPEWEDASGRQFSTLGRTAEISLDGTNNGTRIARDSQGDFANAGGTPDWVIAENVNSTRSFRIYVGDTNLLSDFGVGDAFNVTVSDGTNTWRMNITYDLSSSEVVVGVKEPDNDEFVCDDGSGSIWVNVTEGTIGSEECEGLSFATGVDEPYEVRFNHGDSIDGTYTLIVDNSTLATNPSPHLYDDSSGNEPYAAPAIYSANVSVTYQTPRLYYSASVRVAPGESDD